jgi:hypothetical protein
VSDFKGHERAFTVKTVRVLFLKAVRVFLKSMRSLVQALEVLVKAVNACLGRGSARAGSKNA